MSAKREASHDCSCCPFREKSGNGWPGSLELVSTKLRSCRAFLLNTLLGKTNLKVLFSYFQLNYYSTSVQWCEINIHFVQCNLLIYMRALVKKSFCTVLTLFMRSTVCALFILFFRTRRWLAVLDFFGNFYIGFRYISPSYRYCTFSAKYCSLPIYLISCFILAAGWGNSTYILNTLIWIRILHT
jgi:hypothetical protein